MSSPKLVVVSGPPCAGKSTLSRALAERTGFTRLEMDSIRACLLPSSDLGEADRTIAYRAMHLVAEDLVGRGSPVILDATYSRPEIRQDLESLAQRVRVPLYLLECRVSPGVAVSRFLAGRDTHPAVDLTADRVEKLAGAYPYYTQGTVVDGTGNQAQALETAINYIEHGPPVPTDGTWTRLAQKHPRGL